MVLLLRQLEQGLFVDGIDMPVGLCGVRIHGGYVQADTVMAVEGPPMPNAYVGYPRCSD